MISNLSRLVAVVAPATPELFASKPPDVPAAREEVEWLKGLTDLAGWIAAAPDKANIRPYMASYAAYGFARAAEATGDRSLLEYTRRWVNWYGSHIGSDGFMHDWEITGNIPSDMGADSEDSTDAYPGMLLVALWRYMVAGGDMSLIDALGTLLTNCISAITATQDIDGLTWAKPDYKMKYLEDNIEGLAGLRSAALVAAQQGLASIATDATTAADKLAAGISYMINHETTSYDFAIDEFGTRTATNWDDENHQRQMCWAAAWGIQDNIFGAALMAQYEAHLPTWDTRVPDGVVVTTWEIMPAWAYHRLANRARVRQAMTNLRGNLTALNRAWPYNAGYAGQLIAALSGVRLPALKVPALDGINLLPNPGFVADSNADGLADGLDHYGDSTFALVNTALGKAQSVDVPAGNSWDIRYTEHFAVTPGKWYTLSHYSLIQRLDSGGQHVLKIEWYKADGSLSTYRYNIYNTLDTGFTRRWLSAMAPADAVTCGVFLAIENGGKVQFARVKFEVAGAPTAW